MNWVRLGENENILWHQTAIVASIPSARLVISFNTHAAVRIDTGEAMSNKLPLSTALRTVEGNNVTDFRMESQNIKCPISFFESRLH